jgi:hypothetical protein
LIVSKALPQQKSVETTKSHLHKLNLEIASNPLLPIVKSQQYKQESLFLVDNRKNKLENHLIRISSLSLNSQGCQSNEPQLSLSKIRAIIHQQSCK